MSRRKQLNFGKIDDKLANKVIQDLERFRQTLFHLIGKSQEKLDILEAERKTLILDTRTGGKILDVEYHLLSELISRYRELVDIYVLDLGLRKWPKLLAKKNPETLNKLCIIAFTKLREIQMRLARIIPPVLYDLDNDYFTKDEDDIKDEQKAIDFMHSLMSGASRSDYPICAFERALANFERELPNYK